MTTWDVVIVGAGIAGASLADAIAEHRSVLIIEAEAHPGYHATGRSAAFWTETYGGPLIQPLTSASGPFLDNPPLDFSENSFLKPRGALHLGTRDDKAAAADLARQFAASGVALERIGGEELDRRIPGLRSGWSEALWEPDCADIDVAALHAAYLRSARRKGAKLQCGTALHTAVYRAGAWDVQTSQGSMRAKLLVNAAGAWADDIAVKAAIEPLDIRPYRRTVIQLAVRPAAPPDLPLVIGLDGSFYFKPEAGGKIWLSPHDETPTLPCDAAAEEIDVALAIDRFEGVVDWKIEKLEHKWAGLRSFAPDRLPVVGRDAKMPAFFWLVGQGGFGIQTAPAMAQLAASLIIEGLAPPKGVWSENFLPARF
jgi:D-arginine dehydrogenase